jgi:hypothetical protein
MVNTANLPKHDIRKYQDIVKLTDSNWIDWKDVIETVLVNRGLWRITSSDEGLLLDSRPPHPAIPSALTEADIEKLIEKQEAWDDRDGAARSQILLNLSPRVRLKVRGVRTAAEIWDKLLQEFESHDENRISAVRLIYDSKNAVIGKSANISMN